MRLFDSHCHLDDPVYDGDLDAVLERARASGVVAAMIVSVDRASAEKALAIAESRENLFSSVGIHPHDAKNGRDADLSAMAALARSPKVRAWGEIGLDFNRMFSPRDDQETCFLKQIEWARKLDLPMIFHERESGGRFCEMLRAHMGPSQRGVVHCFSGDEKDLRDCLDLGLHIGITGILTIKSRGKTLRELVRQVPRDRLLIETDAPYLTPTPERNKHRRNEPAFVRSVFFKLAEVLQTPPEDLSAILWENTCRLFRLDPAALF